MSSASACPSPRDEPDPAALRRGCHAAGAGCRVACAAHRRFDAFRQHPQCAASDGRVLYSFNVKDFSLLHARWISAGRQHSGIVLGFQQRYSVGEQLRRLLYLLSRLPAADMLSRLEYLSTWGR